MISEKRVVVLRSILLSVLATLFVTGCASKGSAPKVETANAHGWWIDDQDAKFEIRISASGAFSYSDARGKPLGSGRIYGSGGAHRSPNGAATYVEGVFEDTEDSGSALFRWNDGRIWRRSGPPVTPADAPLAWDSGPSPRALDRCNQAHGVPVSLERIQTSSVPVIPVSALGVVKLNLVAKGVDFIVQQASNEPSELASLLEGPRAHPQGIARIPGHWVISHSSDYGQGLLGVCPDGGSCNWTRLASKHPGGIQACGETVAVSSKDGTFIIDLAARQATRIEGGSEAAGIAYHPEHNRQFLMTAKGEAVYASACANLGECSFAPRYKVEKLPSSKDLAASWDTGGINLFYSESHQAMYVLSYELRDKTNVLAVQRLNIERVSSERARWQDTRFAYSLGQSEEIEVFESGANPLAPSFRYAGFAVFHGDDSGGQVDFFASPRQILSSLGYSLRRDRFRAIPR